MGQNVLTFSVVSCLWLLKNCYGLFQPQLSCMIADKSWIYVRCISWLFAECALCKMIITVRLITTFISPYSFLLSSPLIVSSSPFFLTLSLTPFFLSFTTFPSNPDVLSFSHLPSFPLLLALSSLSLSFPCLFIPPLLSCLSLCCPLLFFSFSFLMVRIDLNTASLATLSVMYIHPRAHSSAI